ncbi:hypothetical protein [Gottfriedia acidiceleris]|uniref:hypothetical protein n=1 Tax=Gottfriedia acidiceleris TaxID=371036 RepID=UPI003D2027A4
MKFNKLVNSIKEGQNNKSALLTHEGNIVELIYNVIKERIEFYSNEGLLGSTPSKEKVEGYAIVKKRESLFKGYHFTMEYIPELTKQDFDADQKKKEKLIQKSLEERQAIDKKLKDSGIFEKMTNLYQEGKIRNTRCWSCGAFLNSFIYSTCSNCEWLICSCGACRFGCSKESQSKIIDKKYPALKMNVNDIVHKSETQSITTDKKYIKCIMDGCIAKIPYSKLKEWNSRCPRHQH